MNMPRCLIETVNEVLPYSNRGALRGGHRPSEGGNVVDSSPSLSLQAKATDEESEPKCFEKDQFLLCTCYSELLREDYGLIFIWGR